jgi:mycothiol synthase
MTFHIRRLEAHEYDIWSGIHNAAFAYWASSVQEILARDARFAMQEHLRFARFLVFKNEKAIAALSYSHNSYQFQATHFRFKMAVPDNSNTVRTAALEFLTQALQVFNVERLQVDVRQDSITELEFYLSNGFSEHAHEFESKLNVSAFDLAPWLSASKKPRTLGYEIRSLEVLKEIPDFKQRFYDLHIQLERDVPSSNPPTPQAFEAFSKRHFETPTLSLSRVLIMVKANANGFDWVGMTELETSDTNPDLHVGLTGVLRGHRRQGLALALKLHSIQHAKTHGFPKICTHNASTNRPMLEINERLGFQKEPATIELHKHL